MIKGGDKGSDLPNEKNKTRGKKNWQSKGFKTYLEYRQHLANEDETEISEETDNEKKTIQ